MKKILLIEDRTTRQRRFANKTGIKLDKYSNILDNCIDDKYNAILSEMRQDNFDFSSYDIIVSHKSIFSDESNSDILRKIEDHCKTYKKSLVLFSGGIDGSYYNNEIYEILELNSKTFYSRNLTLFLDAVKKEKNNLLMLSYGEHWKLNILLNVLENLNLYIDTADSELFKDIDLDRLEQIDIVCGNLDINDNMEKVVASRDSLVDIIKGLTDE